MPIIESSVGIAKSLNHHDKKEYFDVKKPISNDVLVFQVQTVMYLIALQARAMFQEKPT